MARRHYSVAEVEALIPTLEQIFVRLLQLRSGLRGVEHKLEQAGASVDVDEEPTGDEPPEVQQARGVFRAYYEALADELERIRALGGEVKDLDMGLVDFPGHRRGEDILLCWRLGERQIAYWHTVEGGFAGRRPIDEQIPRTPSRLD
jgi:hypothetical protein